MPREIADSFRRNDRIAIEKGGLTINEEALVFGTNDYRGIFETTKTPMHDNQGRIIGVLGISHDITARKALGLGLRDKDAQFRLAIESSPDGFWVTNLEGGIVTVNDAYCRISGYTRGELLGKHIYDIDARYDRATVLGQLARLQGVGFKRFETVHRARDGRLWPVEECWARSTRARAGASLPFPRHHRAQAGRGRAVRDRQARLEAMVAERTAALSAMMTQVSASEERYKFALGPPRTASGTGTCGPTRFSSTPPTAPCSATRRANSATMTAASGGPSCIPRSASTSAGWSATC